MKMKKLLSILGLSPPTKLITEVLEEHELLDRLVREWDTWDTTVEPPAGWVWVEDCSRDMAALVRLNNGIISVIKCRQWNRYRKSPSLKRKLLREARRNENGAD